jgi:ATP-binding cassette, subfamily B, bacterial
MAAEFTARRLYHTDHTNPAGFIWSHVKRHPLAGILMVIGAAANATLAGLVFFFIGEAVNAIVNGPDLETVIRMALAVIGAQLLRATLQLMRNFSAETFAQRIERDVRDELYASLLGKSMSFHDSQPIGEIMARATNDVREMNLMMNPGFNLLIGSGFFWIVPLFTSPAIYPDLIITPLTFQAIYLILQIKYVQALNPLAEAVRRTFGQMNARLAETLDGIQIVKGAAREDQEIQVFNHLADDVRDRFVQQGRREAQYWPQLLLGVMTVLGFLHSIILYRQGRIDDGQVVAFMGQLFLFQFPTFSSMRSLALVALGHASAARILQIITTQTDLDQNRAGHHAPIQGRLEFRKVTFGYGDGEPVLRDVSFTVEPGQTVAIVGQTGAGKTTITKLINRTYEVTDGAVLIDGVDVFEWQMEALRSQISIIEQDILLFSRSIAENIRFGAPDATQEEVEAVARKAQAHDFIMSFPEGYDTVVGQRGVTLSGGQRQRIAIARAFLSNPPILILDDSTSAIDSATEDQIQQAIWAASSGRTTLLITHRLSQIRWADHIVVLRQGRVAAQGTHDDLLRTSEAYRRIFATPERVAAVESPTPG